ncbi:MAG: aldehyde dehydrogenase family protein [Nannocystis sp.]|nr:aldehyde dehydrogenase family protein [Nannocystis sp.]
MSTRVDDHAAPTPRLIERRSPTTGGPLRSIAITEPAALAAAVARARAAAPGWRDTPLERRLAHLERLRSLVLARADEYARRLSDETGKPWIETLGHELLFIPVFLDYHRKNAAKALARHKVKTPILFPGKASYIERFPRGVVAIIAPWNFPFQLAIVPVLQALTAGNTVVLKPSEITPESGEIIRELAAAIELPPGVVEVVQGDGAVGAALCRADVDMIFFTGSVATGRKVMAAAAERPIPVELELGGKDAMILCADAPLERAARAAVWGGLANAGQACISVERIFAVESIHDRFIELVERELDQLRQGAPEDDADVGPMIFEGQLRIVDRHVRAAVADGARLLRGGQRLDRPGNFYAPTLLTGVRPDMEIYRDETFGPVLPVIKVRDEEEALRLANDHQFGLNGSVWTRDVKRGLALASRMECGQVTVNDLFITAANPALPFGGIRSSGIGRYHGEAGLHAFTHTRAIMVDRAFMSDEPNWFPYRGKYPGMLDLFEGYATKNLLKLTRGLLRLRRAGKRDAP